MANNLRFWGTWKGQVVKAIAVDGARTWTDIRDITGLFPKSLNKALAELMSSLYVEKVGDNPPSYRVNYELYKEYRAYFDMNPEKKSTFRLKKEEQEDLIRFIGGWNDYHKMDINLNNKHFFLVNSELSNFMTELINKAKREVFVVNPFIFQCDLSNSLHGSAKKGVSTIVITRNAEDQYSKQEKIKYMNGMRENGVKLYYYPNVHAKIVLVDRTVAIVSSMNFYPKSTSGGSWEAGMVSFEPEVVETISSKVQDILFSKLVEEFQ